MAKKSVRVVIDPTQPLTASGLTSVKLFIAVPTYMGVVHSGCMLSLFKLTHELRNKGIQQHLRMLDGEMVARARNRLVADFLESDCTHMLFLDSDITFNPESLLRMLWANLGVVGGVYPKKQMRWQGAFNHARTAGSTPETTAEAALSYVVNALPNGKGKMVRDCFSVSYVGTGFLLIQRPVIEAMVKQYRKLRYTDDCPDAAPRTIPALFDYKIVGDRYLSEDYYFCDLWRRMGGTVWAAANCPLAHAGSHVFTGDFGKRLRPSNGAPINPSRRIGREPNSQREI